MELPPGVTAKQGLLPGEKAPRPPPTYALGNYKINWLSTSIIFIPSIVVAAALLMGVEMQAKTMAVGLLFYLLNGFGITVGYHRMFAHRAFNGHWAVQWAMAALGAGAFQGSIKWWGRNHRAHHRYIDTDRDPYNATRGFFFTHVGWMIMKQDYDLIGYVDIGDLKANRIVRIQHKHYLPFAMLAGVVAPTLICGLGWGDWVGGYCYAALLKMMLVHHCTFFINSLAHAPILGASQNFSEKHSSQDSILCALLTFGEGYHNFHHEFAQDYRNGIKWYHFDPTKWLIRALELCGLAKNLVRTPTVVIERNMATVSHDQHQRVADEMRKKLERMDQRTAQTAMWTWEEVQAKVEAGRKLTVVGDYIVDLEKKVPTGQGYTHGDDNVVWYNAHPGGRRLLDMFVGKDATDVMTGTIYKHSEGAFNIVQHLRVASLKH